MGTELQHLRFMWTPSRDELQYYHLMENVLDIYNRPPTFPTIIHLYPGQGGGVSQTSPGNTEIHHRMDIHHTHACSHRVETQYWQATYNLCLHVNRFVLNLLEAGSFAASQHQGHSLPLSTWVSFRFSGFHRPPKNMLVGGRARLNFPYMWISVCMVSCDVLVVHHIQGVFPVMCGAAWRADDLYTGDQDAVSQCTMLYSCCKMNNYQGCSCRQATRGHCKNVEVFTNMF